MPAKNGVEIKSELSRKCLSRLSMLRRDVEVEYDIGNDDAMGDSITRTNPAPVVNKCDDGRGCPNENPATEIVAGKSATTENIGAAFIGGVAAWSTKVNQSDIRAVAVGGGGCGVLRSIAMDVLLQ